MPLGSLSFDRAAASYDETRGFPPGAAGEVAAGLCRLAGLQRGDPLLEVGAGTGRLALPLAGQGLRVVGVDLSRPMLEALRGKDRAGRVRLVQGDALALPFSGATFAAVLLVYLLHLIPKWREALAEAVRVLRPGGALLLCWTGWDEHDPLVEVWGRWREFVVLLGGRVGWPGAADLEPVLAALEGMGLRRAALEEVARWPARVAPADLVEMMAGRVFSDSWNLPDPLHRAALERLRRWVGRRYEDPERPVEVVRAFWAALWRP